MPPQRRPGRLWSLTGVLVTAVTWAGAVRAEAQSIDVHAGRLRDALAELVREQNLDILYAADLVRGRQAPAVKGRLSTEQALAQLLVGSGLGYRITSDGVFVLFERPRVEIADPGDGAIAEVLVLGRRSQNTDIRRTENDIQPYRVIGARDLALAAQDNVEQHLRERLPANAQVMSPGQNVNGPAGTNSAIDLRGIGVQRTLVLVDGRRLPSLPTRSGGLEQSDLNAIPLGAIARIETLTATAGGIHGPAALGGVVNVVLKRDYRGADITLASGLSGRGDAGHGRIEGRIGFTPDHGRTDVMLAASYSAAQRLRVGQRDYARRSLQWQAANNPSEFLSMPRAVDALTVRTSNGEALRLDAAYGGTVLSSSYSYLPLDFVGSNQEKAAALAINAGRLPTVPATGLAGDDTSLISTPTTRSLLLSIRHTLGDRIEVFIDGMELHNNSRAVIPRPLTYPTESHANAAGNLFANTVYFNFPLPGLLETRTVTTTARRMTAGLVTALPGHWQASADYSLGRSTLDYRRHGLAVSSDVTTALWNGYVGARGQAPVVPLGDGAALQAAVMAYAIPSADLNRAITQFSSATVRAAGPLFALPGGAATATLVGEVRRERMPETDYAWIGESGPRTTQTLDRTQRVASGYFELRAPVTRPNSRFLPFRNLELQLAVRRDEVWTTFPDTVLTGAATVQVRAVTRHKADVFTLGARAFPVDGLMLRASAATGEAPPDMSHLQETGIVANSAAFSTTDPKRGARPIVADGPYLWGRTGWHGVGQEKGQTRSIGLVFNPSRRNGPRLSVDVSRVEIRDEIDAAGITLANLMAQEERYRGRVVREPLTAADAAKGYTAGRVIAVYAGRGNVGRTVAKTVDWQLDWSLPEVLNGSTLLYGAATWQPTLRSRRRADTPWLDRVGYRDGPLEWRGNGGLQWSRGPVIIDLNAQYLGRSSPRWSAYSVVNFQTAARNQVSDHTAGRVYVDLVARRRFDFAASDALRALDVRLAVQNLLDTSPPIVADPLQMGYDYRGDPRRRRFELSLTGRF